MIAASLAEHGAAAAASVPPAEGAPALAEGTPPVGEEEDAAVPPAPPGTIAGLPGDPPAVPAKVAGGTPTEGLGVAAVTVGMILLVLTALTVHGLSGGRSDSHQWRSALEAARTARQDLRMRGEALPVVVLLVVSLALWSAIVLWVVAR